MHKTNFTNTIKLDWAANKGNARSRVILLLFRLAQQFSEGNIVYKVILFPAYVMYRFIVQIFIGFDVPCKARIGPGVRVFHCQAIVIHPGTVIGKNCTLRHSTTIGSRYDAGGAPSIGDSVDMGCNVVVLGGISIGEFTTIGASSLVLSDADPHSVLVGSPARAIKKM